MLMKKKCTLCDGREDKVNLNCSENDQQWRCHVSQETVSIGEYSQLAH